MYKLGTGEYLWSAREEHPEVFLEQFRVNVLKPLGHAFIHRALALKLSERKDTSDFRILEIGHGANSPLFELYAARPGVECHGIDENDHDRTVSPVALASLRARYPGVTFHTGYIGESSGLPSDYYDMACSVSVVEHVPVAQLDAFHRDIHRILRAGGEQIHSYDRPWGGDVASMKAAIENAGFRWHSPPGDIGKFWLQSPARVMFEHAFIVMEYFQHGRPREGRSLYNWVTVFIRALK